MSGSLKSLAGSHWLHWHYCNLGPWECTVPPTCLNDRIIIINISCKNNRYPPLYYTFAHDLVMLWKTESIININYTLFKKIAYLKNCIICFFSNDLLVIGKKTFVYFLFMKIFINVFMYLFIIYLYNPALLLFWSKLVHFCFLQIII